MDTTQDVDCDTKRVDIGKKRVFKVLEGREDKKGGEKGGKGDK